MQRVDYWAGLMDAHWVVWKADQKASLTVDLSASSMVDYWADRMELLMVGMLVGLLGMLLALVT